jgi:hypothetical protein
LGIQYAKTALAIDKNLVQVMAAITLLFGTYLVWSRWELNQLEVLCAEIHPGSDVTGLGNIVEKHGFSRKWVEATQIRDSEETGYLMFIPATSTFGEFTCTIRHNGESVLSAGICGEHCDV